MVNSIPPVFSAVQYRIYEPRLPITGPEEARDGPSLRRCYTDPYWSMPHMRASRDPMAAMSRRQMTPPAGDRQQGVVTLILATDTARGVARRFVCLRSLPVPLMASQIRARPVSARPTERVSSRRDNEQGMRSGEVCVRSMIFEYNVRCENIKNTRLCWWAPAAEV
jgi:hypothetical protein